MYYLKARGGVEREGRRGKTRIGRGQEIVLFLTHPGQIANKHSFRSDVVRVNIKVTIVLLLKRILCYVHCEG